jgi:nitrilase
MHAMPREIRAAVVQRPPVLLDLAASLEVAIEALREAAGEGAELVVFPEAFLPGYPTWVWRLRPGVDHALSSEIHSRLRRNAVDLSRDGLRPFRDAVAEAGVTAAIGLHELDPVSGSTLFNTVAVIGPDAALLHRHRKLMPTNPERMVWGMGDGSGLRVIETPAGRIGCLICWESYMPLARAALYAQDLEIYLAPTWDFGERWQATLRHVSTEGGCWVIGTATALQGRDVPAGFPGRDQLYPDPDEWINDGGATVVAPFGRLAAGPSNRDKAILYATIDRDRAADARRSLDVSGHYARPDVLRLTVDRSVRSPVSFEDG